MISEVKERFLNYFLRRLSLIQAFFGFIWGLIYKYYGLEVVEYIFGLSLHL